MSILILSVFDNSDKKLHKNMSARIEYTYGLSYINVDLPK